MSAQFVKHIGRVVASTLLTCLTLAGGLILIFRGLMWLDNGIRLIGTQAVLSILLIIGGLAISGALWGGGVALLYGAEVKSTALTSGRNWALIIFIAAILLDVVNAMQTILSRALGVSRHAVFVTAFAIGVSIATALVVRAMIRMLGYPDRAARIALITGAAAMLAYLAVDVLLRADGWMLGRPRVDVRSVMVTMMLSGMVGASLAGGAAMAVSMLAFTSDPSPDGISSDGTSPDPPAAPD